MPSQRGKKRKTRATIATNELDGDDAGATLAPAYRENWPGWVEMESEPAFFNVMLKELGVRGVKVHEMYAVDDEMLAILPQPVHALIFLFRYHAGDDEGKGTHCPDHVWFANQIPDFACGTVALLNVVNNIAGLDMGRELSNFKQFTEEMCPFDRGDAIDNFDYVRRIHNSFARENDILYADMIARDNAMKVKRKRAAAKGQETKKLKQEQTPLQKKSVNVKATSVRSSTRTATLKAVATAPHSKSSPCAEPPVSTSSPEASSPVAPPSILSQQTSSQQASSQQALSQQTSFQPKSSPQASSPRASSPPASSAQTSSLKAAPPPEEPTSEAFPPEEPTLEASTLEVPLLEAPLLEAPPSEAPRAAVNKARPVSASSSPLSDIVDSDAYLDKPSKAKRKKTTRELKSEKPRRKSARATKPRKDAFATDAAAEAEESEDQYGFHFIAYLPIQNHVWRMDGLDPYPQDVGIFDENAPDSWLKVAQSVLQNRMALYGAGGIEFNLMAVVHDPAITDRDLLAQNVKLLQRVDEQLDRVESDWRSLEGAETKGGVVTGLSVEFGISQADIDGAELAKGKAGKIEKEENLRELIRLRREIIDEQAPLRAGIRDAVRSSEEDDEKARHRRHDYGTFVKSWLGALEENDALGELL